jgi:hypothetical protein
LRLLAVASSNKQERKERGCAEKHLHGRMGKRNRRRVNGLDESRDDFFRSG